jgi:hypothetical protein
MVVVVIDPIFIEGGRANGLNTSNEAALLEQGQRVVHRLTRDLTQISRYALAH